MSDGQTIAEVIAAQVTAPAAGRPDTRVGGWMITFTGRRFWPLDPRPNEVDIRDIAHSLSLKCRYGGHTRRHFSVAEHCCLMAGHFIRLGRPDLARWALMHDGAEAYGLGDAIRPVKPFLDGFAAIEAEVAEAIFVHVGLSGEMPPEVKAADNAIIGDEARAMFSPAQIREAGWVLDWEPLGVTVTGQRAEWAEANFLTLFHMLFPGLAR